MRIRFRADLGCCSGGGSGVFERILGRVSSFGWDGVSLTICAGRKL